ncbi:MAG: hypothetical protein WCR72_15695 [Bacteroidota bacterium]
MIALHVQAAKRLLQGWRLFAAAGQIAAPGNLFFFEADGRILRFFHYLYFLKVL